MHTILLILVVVALLAACLSFTGRAWGLQGSVILLCVVLLLTLSGVGCGSRQVVATETVGLIVRRGPPCDLSLSADGEEVCRVRSVERCELTIDGEVRP